MLAVARGL